MHLSFIFFSLLLSFLISLIYHFHFTTFPRYSPRVVPVFPQMLLSPANNIDVSRERQVSIQVQLSDFQSQALKQSSDAMEQLRKLRKDVLEAVQTSLPQILPSSANQQPSQDSSEQLRALHAIQQSLDRLVQSKIGPLPEIRILKQLYFGSLYRRKDDMAPADVDTFDWILGYTGDHPVESPGEDAAKQAAASRFMRWLREGTGIFHISGKPGSGKSTMMKLLLSDERTRQELERWAGEKQLVFAHFFFWSSGERLQHTLEGLYRSILFETLIQCPELIPEVFPRAYRAFSKTDVEHSIDELFFGSNEIKKAFEDLITRPPRPGYCFCFFIDGLDEYGGDDIAEWEYQILADALASWAAHEDVKILASSRPYRPFEDSFPDEQRIRLHELTRSDIALACRQMFERDKCLERSDIRRCYVRLAEDVANASDGVFLWASLATRALLNAIGRYDPIDSLWQLLQGIPRDFNKLYEKLFTSIDPVDQARAFKLLLLVAEAGEVVGESLNALGITWLNELEDPDFPMKYGFRPYTDEEIDRRYLEAKYQVASLTKGLLEIEKSGSRSSIQRWHVRFFHRTVRDFVRQSKAVQEFATKVPNLTHRSTYARLLLAELHFARVGDIRCDGLSRIATLYEEGHALDDALLDSLGQAWEHHNESSKTLLHDPTGPYGRVVGLSMPPAGRNYGHESFLHLLALGGVVGYVQRKVTANPALLRPQGSLSLLLSAALGRNPAMARALLDAGASPHDLVCTVGQTAAQFTVWQLVCTALVCLLSTPFWRQDRLLRELCTVIQHFLEAGADSDCYVQFGWSRCSDEEPHAVSLRAFIKELNPPNLGELLKLMDEPKPSQGIGRAFRTVWNYLTGTNFGTAAAPSSHSDGHSPHEPAVGPDISEKKYTHIPVLAVVFGERRVDPSLRIRLR